MKTFPFCHLPFSHADPPKGPLGAPPNELANISPPDPPAPAPPRDEAPASALAAPTDEKAVRGNWSSRDGWGYFGASSFEPQFVVRCGGLTISFNLIQANNQRRRDQLGGEDVEKRGVGGEDARLSELDVRPPDDSRVSLVGLVERLERQGRAVKLDDVVAVMQNGVSVLRVLHPKTGGTGREKGRESWTRSRLTLHSCASPCAASSFRAEATSPRT